MLDAWRGMGICVHCKDAQTRTPLNWSKLTHKKWKKLTVWKQRYKRVKLQNQEKLGGYKLGI